MVSASPQTTQHARATKDDSVSLRTVLLGGAILAVLIWSYWPTIEGLIVDWETDQNYSVGQLVPLAALYLIWTDRQRFIGRKVCTCWWGLGLILLAQGARYWGFINLYESAERYSMILTVAGCVLLTLGWAVFWQAKWILAFLLLMIPLPGIVHNMLSDPLQAQASGGAVFLLELFGTTVTREGNVLVLNDTVPVAVAEACSGLRMLTAFVVVGCVLAYVVNRPIWQKVVLVICTIPVAILCNLIRLVVTARLFLAVGSETAEKFFHDFAGWTMMPMAIGFLVFGLWIMSRIVVPEDSAGTHRPSTSQAS